MPEIAEVSVVIPTFNEVENVGILIERLEGQFEGVRWEALFVDDDSTDGTRDALMRLAQEKPHVRMIHRIGRRGLSSAVVEGILSTTAPYVAVMDADLQHDEALLPGMLETLRGSDAEIVVGSRYTDGGGVGDWDKTRIKISQFAGWLARTVTKSDLTDPMSGFFMLKREAFDRSVRNLSKEGYKILLDIFASSPVPMKFRELPYTFRVREHGESKLDSLVVWEYLVLLLDKLVGRYIPVRFLMFGMIGGSGVFVHFAALFVCFKLLGVDFAVSQGIATFVAMNSNFFLNNILTYRDRRLRGVRLIWGLLSFYAICGLGVVGNVGVADMVFEGMSGADSSYSWAVAGAAGALISVVWNYVVTAWITWRRR
jgi:dolichol-phosphate mannosyltransferase